MKLKCNQDVLFNEQMQVHEISILLAVLFES